MQTARMQTPSPRNPCKSLGRKTLLEKHNDMHVRTFLRTVGEKTMGVSKKMSFFFFFPENGFLNVKQNHRQRRKK